MEANVDFYFENAYYDIRQVQNSFKLKEEPIDYLIGERYLKRHQQSIFFSFVGLLHYRDKLIFVLPKYLKLGNLSYGQKIEEAYRVTKVLKKVGKTYTSLPDLYNITSQDHHYAEIALADYLISDYLEYGLLTNEKVEYEENGTGDIDWELTINTFVPVFNRKYPIYETVKTFGSIVEHFNVVTELHKWALNNVSIQYGKWLGFDLSIPFDSVRNLSDLGTEDYLLTILSRELNLAYADRKIRLIKGLIAIIKKHFEPRENQLKLYGTGYFHIVWEKVLSYVFNNRIEQWTNLIAKPQWGDLEGKYYASDPLKPDIISHTKELGDGFFILDAKYYNIQYKYYQGDLSLSNHPGLGDIIKQFLYEKALENVNANRKYNCFLFPKVQSEPIEIIGNVQFELFPNKRIWVVTLSPTIFMDSFLTNRKFGEENLGYLAEIIDFIEDIS